MKSLFIKNLNTKSNSPPSERHLDIINLVFNNDNNENDTNIEEYSQHEIKNKNPVLFHQKVLTNLKKYYKHIILIVILYIVLSSPTIDSMLRNHKLLTNIPHIVYKIFKTVLFTVLSSSTLVLL